MKNSEVEIKLITIIAELYEMDLQEQNKKTRTLIERAIGGLVRAKAELDEDKADDSQGDLFNKTTSDEIDKFYSSKPGKSPTHKMVGDLINQHESN